MKRIGAFLKKVAAFLLNPHFLLCFGVAWLITNGWSYIMLGLGTFYQIGWMIALSSAYLTFLWLPVSPEKIVTFAIALALLEWWFPKDTKTLGVMHELYEKAKNGIKKRRRDRKKDGE